MSLTNVTAPGGPPALRARPILSGERRRRRDGLRPGVRWTRSRQADSSGRHTAACARREEEVSGPAAPRGPRCRTSADGQPPGAPGRLTLLPRPQAPRLTRCRSQRKDTRSFSLKSTFKRNKTRVLPRNVPSFVGNKNKEKEKHSHDCSKRAEPGGRGAARVTWPQLGVPAAPAPPWSPSPQLCSGTCGDEAVRTGRRHPELPGAESRVPRSVTGRAGGAGDAAATPSRAARLSSPSRGSRPPAFVPCSSEHGPGQGPYAGPVQGTFL